MLWHVSFKFDKIIKKKKLIRGWRSILCVTIHQYGVGAREQMSGVNYMLLDRLLVSEIDHQAVDTFILSQTVIHNEYHVQQLAVPSKRAPIKCRRK